MRLRDLRIVEWGAFVLIIAIAAVIVLNVAVLQVRHESGRPFLIAAIITQTATFWLSRDTLMVRGLRSTIPMYFWPVLYILFFSYMNHPWFPGFDPSRCDGRCNGWLGFENDSWLMYLPLLCASTFGIGAISLFLGKTFRLDRRRPRRTELDEMFTTEADTL